MGEGGRSRIKQMAENPLELRETGASSNSNKFAEKAIGMANMDGKTVAINKLAKEIHYEKKFF